MWANWIPVEYGVMNNGHEMRMVAASDYAALKSAYYHLLHILQEHDIDPDKWEDD
jgi:hypothetical protein